MGGSDQTHEDELRLGDIKLRAGARLGAYIYRKPLAEGGMAHVLLVSDPGNRLIALKLLNRVELALHWPDSVENFAPCLGWTIPMLWGGVVWGFLWPSLYCDGIRGGT